MRTRHLLTAFVAASVILAACGSDDDSSDSATTDAGAATEATTGDASAATTPAASEAPAGTTGDAAATGTATVMVTTGPELGDYVVDGTGRTLYVFTKDEGTTTACTGDCPANWPPIVAEDPTGGDGIDAALLGIADGIEPNQVTYNGHLLYYFANDTAPGDTNGIGLPNWYAVSPAGEAIDND